MLMMQKMHQMMVRRPSGYRANAVEFDGVNDYLSKASAISAVSSSQGSLAVWLRPDIDAARYLLFGAAGDFSNFVAANIGATGEIAIDVGGPGSEFLFISSSGVLSTSATWKLALASWDTNFSSGNKLKHLYIGDTNAFDSVSADGAAFSTDYSTFVATEVGSVTPLSSDYFDGGMAELWFSTEYIDFSVEANRRKFINATGKPVSLGADGSLPTGTAPAIYLKGDYTSFGTNSGTGGDFTVTGALTAAATSPSD